MWSPVGGWESSGRGGREGGQWSPHCGLGRMQEPLGNANLGQEQQPVLGKEVMLRTKREVRGTGAGGGVSWELEECSGPQAARGGRTAGGCHTVVTCDRCGWAHPWSDSPLRNINCYVID